MEKLYKKLNYSLFLGLIIACAACRKADNAPAPVKSDTVRNIQKSQVDTIPTPVAKPDTTTKVIVVLGSSTAAGWGPSKPDSSWVNRLQKRFDTDKKKARIINLALGGFTTYQMMPNGFNTPSGRPQPDINRNVTKALLLHPDMILINMPTNDIANNYSDEEIMANFQTVVKLIADSKTDYILTGTQPRNFAWPDQCQHLKTLDDKLVSTFKGHVNSILTKLSTPAYTILDKYSAGDGVHLNDKGHAVIYESFVKFFQSKNLLDYKVVRL